MADKQATVYIVDQGKSMGEKRNGRDETDLEYGMRYIWGKITETLLANRATFTVGVVGLRTDNTDNPLQDEDSYENISILQPICAMKMSHLKELQECIKVNETDAGDSFSAIIVAVDMISEFTKKLKYNRKIVLVTNARGPMDDDGAEELVEKMNGDNIQLVVVGVDSDDAEYGFKEEDKDFVKASNEALLRSLVDRCNNGIFGTMAEAIEGLTVPRVKETRPYCCYKGQLLLGDPEKYDTAMCIDVERFFKTHIAKPLSASSFVIGYDEASAQSSLTLRIEDDVAMGGTADQGGLTSVKNSRLYKVKDSSAVGGTREVDFEDLARGYEYGRTAVHISALEENVTKLETLKDFSIIGFIPCSGYERFFNLGETNVIIAERTNEKAKIALSSLIHALHELDSYAIARIVTRDGLDPILLLLSPSIEPDLECLIDVPLPFTEDLRSYRFPPLDRVMSSSGATLTKHRNLPTQELTDAMSAYVDSMDLSTFGRDDEGEPTEYMAIEDTYSPIVHRVNQAVKQRAVKPNEKVLPPAEILVKYSNPPKDLLEKSTAQLKRLIAIADVKKVPPKAKGKRGRETMAPLSGLDVDSLLSQEKRVKISPENAIPEFKRMLSTAESLDTIKDAAKQMAYIIRSLITHSLGDSGYPRAVANLLVMQEELIDMEEPGLYNDFIRDLKERIMAGDLGGDRREMMWEIRKERLGLIDKSRSELSDVTEAEASDFYSMKGELPFRVTRAPAG